MKTAILAFLFLLFAANIGASQSFHRFVVWNGEPGCGQHSRAFTEKDVIACATIVTDRGPVSTIRVNGIKLAAAFLDDGHYSLVAAQITNNTDGTIGFDSDLWGAAYFRTKSGFVSGEKPIIAELSMPSRDIIRGMSYENRLGTELGEFIADTTLVTDVKIITKPDGTKVKKITQINDKDAQAEAERLGSVRNETLTKEQRRIRDTALTAKTVEAGGSVKGLVYFRRHKEAEFVTYSLKVEDTTFVFLLPKTNKQKNN
ncbi:MAG: hypothetical protein JO053_03170 [Acidobacteria bacterium]|nr:hypothetical protein [Acidobacteriota bacterium]